MGAAGYPGVQIGTCGQVVSQRIGRQLDSPQQDRHVGTDGPGLEIQPHAPPGLAGGQSREINTPRFGAHGAAMENRRRKRQHRTGRRGTRDLIKLAVKCRDRADRHISQGILPTPDRYLERVAKRFGSPVASPGISPAVSGPNVSWTNLENVSSSRPVSGFPSRVGPVPSCSRMPEIVEPPPRCARACCTLSLMPAGRRGAGDDTMAHRPFPAGQPEPVPAAAPRPNPAAAVRADPPGLPDSIRARRC